MKVLGNVMEWRFLEMLWNEGSWKTTIIKQTYLVKHWFKILPISQYHLCLGTSSCHEWMVNICILSYAKFKKNTCQGRAIRWERVNRVYLPISDMFLKSTQLHLLARPITVRQYSSRESLQDSKPNESHVKLMHTIAKLHCITKDNFTHQERASVIQRVNLVYLPISLP